MCTDKVCKGWFSIQQLAWVKRENLGIDSQLLNETHRAEGGKKLAAFLVQKGLQQNAKSIWLESVLFSTLSSV